MIEQSKLNEYQKRQSEWRDIGVTQLSNTNYILLTLSAGLLALSFDKQKISSNKFDYSQNFDWPITLYSLYVVLLSISIGYGITVLFSRLYDLRISRHIILTRIRVYIKLKGFKLPDDDLDDINFRDRMCVLWQIIFSKLPFIQKKEITCSVSKTVLISKFQELRKMSKVLGMATWRWTKIEVILLFLSSLIYFVYRIIL